MRGVLWRSGAFLLRGGMFIGRGRFRGSWGVWGGVAALYGVPLGEWRAAGRGEGVA